VQVKRFKFIPIVLALALGTVGNPSRAIAQLNVTVNGGLGDLDGSGDGGTGEAAVLQTTVACWAVRVGTNRNFTLNVMTAALTGGTIGQGATTAVSGAGIPTTGRITMDNDGSTVYFVDATPLVSAEFQPDPVNQWRFVNGTNPANQTDLYSVVSHEVGHALGWVCGAITGAPVACGFTNPNYDGMMNPTPVNFVLNTVVNLQAGVVPPLNVPLRGDGLGAQNLVLNELSHPGIVGDLMRGFYTAGTRELQSVSDVNMFAGAYADTVNLPPTVNAGANILSECNASGGSNVTLNGTGTTDPENDALTFNWACPGIPLLAANSTSPGGFFPLGPTVTCRLDVSDLAACPASASTVQVSVRDTTSPNTTCPAPITVECTAPGGTPASNPNISAFLGAATATDVCDPSLSISNNAPEFFNLGNTPVQFSTTDDSLNPAACSALVQVVDTTPPTLASLTATPNALWPPNHKMMPISVAVSVSDVCDASASCQIVSVTSNQPIDGTGDGDTAPDWAITGSLTLQLRAERAGNLGPRVYTITVACTDGSGNSSTKLVSVTVAHDQN
jgi:hypothetical protein